jgi:pimeloyl-ACP methyl ester carboxylesterase
MNLLSPSHRVLAPDCYGSGKSPEWPSDQTIRLDDEVDLLEPVLAAAGDSCILVGHSYGGAVALIAALRHPERVRALALYEPTLFAVVDAEKPPPNGADGIRNTVAAAGAALDAGDREGAARCFIDFWMGDGSWNLMPAERRPTIADSVVNVRRWSHALFTEPTPAKAFANVRIPVLYMVGENSPESARAVARILLPVLPRVRAVHLTGVGHMAPVTNPEAINAEIERFLGEV